MMNGNDNVTNQTKRDTRGVTLPSFTIFLLVKNQVRSRVYSVLTHSLSVNGSFQIEKKGTYTFFYTSNLRKISASKVA